MKKGKRAIMGALLALCMTFTFAVPQSAAAQEEEITILYTNDIHSYIDNNSGDEAGWNYAKLAHLKDSYKNVLLVDAGDHIQGTAYGSMDKGEMIMDLMVMAGYDLATVGNHEFDYGMDRAMEVMTGYAVPYVSCNFYHEKEGKRGENVLDSYKIFETGGKKIAFIGVTTPESFTKSTPAYFQDEDGNYIYGISGGDDGQALYDDVQKAIDQARAEGADYVIALGHLGIDESSAPWRSTDVISNTAGLDAFIDGHSHHSIQSQMIQDKDGQDVLLTQTGSYFDSVGELTISSGGTLSAQLLTETGLDEEGNVIPDFTERPEDPEVAAVEESWISSIQESLGQTIGYSQVVLDNYDENGRRLVRRQETNTGDFTADALYYLFDEMDMDVDVAIMNGGGIRNGAITGELTYLSCKDIHTFGNVACLMEVSGQQILDALEWGAKDYSAENPDSESGGFLHVSGLTYEINPYIRSTVQSDEHGVWTGGPTGEYRVRNVMIYDRDTGRYEPLDLYGTYRLAGYNYTLRDLGDGFAMFDGAENIIDYVMEDYLVLANYIESFPTDAQSGLPTITAENSPYGSVYGEGRITAKCSHDVAQVKISGTIEATCTEAGYTGDAICPTCGQVVEEGQIVAALGHEYQDGRCVRCDAAETAVSQTPETGDQEQARLWLLALIAAAGIGGAASGQKKRSENR